MRIVLFFLPGIIYRLPDSIEHLLDLGPTVYIPIAFRHRVQHIYTSDYAAANRHALLRWIRGEHGFDWTNVCLWLAGIEASHESPQTMQEYTRSKMRAVLHVDVHANPVVIADTWTNLTDSPIPAQFHVVATVFCLEYASESKEEYRRAVANATGLVRPGGYLLQGGVLNAKEYSFAGRRFRCHHLTESELLSCLKENGMTTSGLHFKLITHEDVFVLISRKCSGAEPAREGLPSAASARVS